MKILIISRTILPSQSPRSHRATELAKEFSRQGHDVILYAVLGNFVYNNFERAHNLKVKNIGKMRFAKINSDGTPRRCIFDKVFYKLFFRLMEFPDIELMFKIPRILKKEGEIDLLITVATPYPIHWGAALFKTTHAPKFPKNWVADCGDPYMGNKFFRRLFYFKYVEKWFCKKTDFLTVPFEGAKAAYYKEFHSKIKIIPQGFNFNEPKIQHHSPDNQVSTFIYAGVFYKGKRDPQLFLEYLVTLHKNFKFIIYTKNRNLVAHFLSELNGKLEVKDYIPREKLLNEMSKADFLVNFENITTTQYPSKLIDYALAGRPVLSVNSQSLNKDTINEFIDGNYDKQLKFGNLEQYDIKNVANSFIKLSKL